MATKAKDRPGTAPPRTRYEDDLYTWVQEQVALLRAGRLAEVDAENVAEELFDVGISELKGLRSSIAVLTQHLLKWDHQPRRRSLSWVATVNEQRRQIKLALEESPGLKPKLGKLIEHGYATGRDRAVAETGLDYDTFPEACPYTFDEMMSKLVKLDRQSKKRRARQD